MSISPAKMARRGWTREGSKSKLQSRWSHRDGWTLAHCGHPTALHPWILEDAGGRVYLSGSRIGEPGNGFAWNTLEEASAWLELELTRRAAGLPPLVSRFVLDGKTTREVA